MSSPSWFSTALLPWYAEHRRLLPWRNTRDPYSIWLSEVILQQTRVDQGLAYYQRFLQRWPTVARLAAASEDEVLKQWQGLGYYSRARNLLVAARQVAGEHGGKFPGTHAELVGLKGVGDYTAAAIASICFDRPDAVVDGNVYRVLARVFGIPTPIDSTAGRKEFKQLATKLLDPDNPGDHNQAVMELGATICTPKAPRCPACPLQHKCVALGTGRVHELPVKQGTTRIRDRWFNYLHILQSGTVHLHQRTGKDIWQGLFEPPLIESEKVLAPSRLRAVLDRTYGRGWMIQARNDAGRHVLSHQHIHIVFWQVAPPKGFKPPSDWIPVASTRLEEYAVPRPIERWLKLLMEEGGPAR
ncbi:MAG TPA: A/G-specific adenine glycosylase [Flavobacteriales bacterium]